jgi:hypothetical protein
MKMRTWENVNKVQRVLLLLVLVFIVATSILTWYALSYLGLNEANVQVASSIQSYGVPLGLLFNSLTSIAFIFLLWVLWILFPLNLKRRSKLQRVIRPLNLILIFLFTFVFMLEFWPWLFDFANDNAQVFFRSNMFFSLLTGKDLAGLATAVLALISTTTYLAFSPDFKKLAFRKRKREA